MPNPGFDPRRLNVPIILVSDHKKTADRRHKKDWVCVAIEICAALAWVLIIGDLLLIASARPEGENFFSRVLDYTASHGWEEGPLRFSMWMMFGTFALCVVGLIFNSRRMRRKADRISPSLVVLGILSLVGGILTRVLFF